MNLQQADAWLRLSAERLHDQARTLTQRDQAIGDGDHGINMERVFTAIVAMLDLDPGATSNGDGSGQAVSGLLRQAGRTLIRTVGGASGPLYGTALLRAAAVFARVCRAAREHSRPVAVCGEAGGSPLLASLLVGLGVTMLSVAAHSVPAVHQALTGLDFDACRAAADAALHAHTSAEVQAIAEGLLH
jgi:dihydroxyacetone kinase-like protein